MEIGEMMVMLDSVFIHDFPSVNREYLDGGFREALRTMVVNQGIPNYALDDNGSPNLNWLSFLWWVFRKDTARINDALHGYIWSPEGNGKALNPVSGYDRIIMSDPVARAERIKVKDYIKHINWIYHKTQDLPNITFIGGGNIPERLHDLRQSKITLLDPEIVISKDILFPDHIQRRNFNVMSSNGIYSTSNRKDSILSTQNVVIINKRDITFAADELERTIVKAGELLTQHGRCLFDVPMYGSALYGSRLFESIRPFVKPPTKFIFSNATAIDGYVHEVIAYVNHSEEVEKDGYFFEIEDMKLTDVGLSRSVAMRIYLKKICKD